MSEPRAQQEQASPIQSIAEIIDATGQCSLRDYDDPRVLEEVYARHDGRVFIEFTSLDTMCMGNYWFLTLVEGGSPPFILERTRRNRSWKEVARFVDSGEALKAFDDLNWICKRLRPTVKRPGVVRTLRSGT
jgi:hypothetical protein